MVSQVTVLVPNYNGAVYLRECLESIVAQTFADWELVVGDNASTDASLSIVASMADRRIRTVRRPRTIGWVANVNLLLAEASTPYVAILHADDWWQPAFLETTVAMLQAAPRSLVATCAGRVVRAGRAAESVGLFQAWPVSLGSTCPAGEVARLLTRRNLMPSATVLARAELYRRFPRYEPALPLLGDWLMWLRAVPNALHRLVIGRGEQPLGDGRAARGQDPAGRVGGYGRALSWRSQGDRGRHRQ